MTGHLKKMRSNLGKRAERFLACAGIRYSSLFYHWRKEFQQKGQTIFRAHGVLLNEDAKRIVELEKRLGEADTERDLFKKL